jgi:hypothetical protein
MPVFNVLIENPGARELRKFGLIFGAILVTIFGLALPWLFSSGWPLWPWIVAAIFWILGLAIPNSLWPIYRIWMKFGHVAGWVNSRIILAIMFYLIFLPAGIIMRIFGKDPMARKLDKTSNSYRIQSQTVEKDHIERPY